MGSVASKPEPRARRPPPEAVPPPREGGARPHPLVENCRANTSIKVNVSTCKKNSQATKSQRWMPWRQMPMKDVDGCEKPRGAAYQASIRGSPNGETRQGSCLVTPACTHRAGGGNRGN